MHKSFKVSTFVTKLLVFSFLVASFGLSNVRASESFKEEDKRVLSQVRLGLWYKGLDKEVKGNMISDYTKVEELRLPMEKILNAAKR